MQLRRTAVAAAARLLDSLRIGVIYASPYCSNASTSSLTLPSTTSAGISTELDEPSNSSVLSKTELLENEGFSEQQIKSILSADPRSDKLAWLLSLLKVRGITGNTAGTFLASNPGFLNSNLNSFRLKLEVLEDAGIRGPLLRKSIFLKCGSLSLCSSPQNLQKHISFLQSLGLDSQGLCLTMSRLPELFKLSIEKNIKPRCELLYSKGISKSGISHILRNHPRVFSGSIKPGLTRRLELLERFDLDLRTKSGVRALGLWSKYSISSLLAKFEFLKTLGFSHDQAVVMVRRQPNVLCMREEALEKKVRFLINVLNRSFDELLSCPGYMTSSLEKRLMPRFFVVEELKEKGLLQKHVPLCSIVTVSGAAFEKRFKSVSKVSAFADVSAFEKRLKTLRRKSCKVQ